MVEDNGGRAFPNQGDTTPGNYNYDGMTMWDYYAAHALSGQNIIDVDLAVRMASEIADKMLIERKKRDGTRD